MIGKVGLIFGLLHCTIVSIAQNVGVKTNTPQATLDVNGKIKLADDNTTPVKGTIRWNESTNDFEGFNGVQWLSLTLSNMQNTGWQQPGQPNGSVSNINQLSSPSTSNSTLFGRSVSIDSNYAVVGAPNEGSNGAFKGGAAYIYSNTDNGNTWNLVTRIIAPNNPDLTPDQFGMAVAVSGNIVAVGAPYRNDGKGVVYIYRTTDNGNTWPLAAELAQSSINDNALLGITLDLDGNLLIVGATGVDEPTLPGNLNPQNDGAVFVYKTIDNGSTWTSTKLNSVGIHYQSGNIPFGSSFGSSVSISNNVIVAGAPFHSPTDDLRFTGMVAIFRTNDNGATWNRTLNTGPERYCEMGRTVSNYGESKIFSSFYSFGGINDPDFQLLFFRDSLDVNRSFNNANNPYTGTIPRLTGNQQTANTNQLYFVVWPVDTVTNSCNAPIPNAKGLVRVFKNINGQYIDYFHITDPTVLLTDNNILNEVRVACFGDWFIIGVPYSGTSDQGKVIFGKIK